MRRLKNEMKIYLNEKILELVDDHTYLGTFLLHNGERVAEMNDRIQRTKSVANEIVQICRETELSRIRLRFVKHRDFCMLRWQGKIWICLMEHCQKSKSNKRS